AWDRRQLVEWINRYLDDPTLYQAQRETIAREWVQFQDGHSYKRLAEAILQHARSSVARGPGSLVARGPRSGGETAFPRPQRQQSDEVGRASSRPETALLLDGDAVTRDSPAAAPPAAAEKPDGSASIGTASSQFIPTIDMPAGSGSTEGPKTPES